MNIHQKADRLHHILQAHHITDYTLTITAITLCGRDYGARQITLIIPSQHKYLAKLALSREYTDLHPDQANQSIFIYDSRLDPGQSIINL